MRKIISVVGARPNFIKMAPIHNELLNYKKYFKHFIVHTGQHYDDKMSDIFFKDLNLPKPNVYLGVGSKSHSIQTAEIMIKFEKIILKEKPDLVLVYGDVNSTVAASLVCSKIYKKNGYPIPVGHIESGLRSNDIKMPEEINRILTDAISNLLFVTEQSGYNNLLKSGFDKEKIFFVGNTMIDSLKKFLKIADSSKVLKELCIAKKSYIVVTLHRPSNVDNSKDIKNILVLFSLINNINSTTLIIFPIHPRTQKSIQSYGLKKYFEAIKNLIITDPLGYIDFLKLIKESKYVITDSGGIQEETTYLKIPCLTLRENTERPSTIIEGTNVLSGMDLDSLRKIITGFENGQIKKSNIPKYWDGNSAKRIVKILYKYFYNK